MAAMQRQGPRGGPVAPFVAEWTLNETEAAMTCRWLMLPVAIGALAPVPGGASDYLDALGPGDLDWELARTMEAAGCTMTETAMLDRLRALGADISMAQAVIVDLARLGDLSWDKADSYTLTGWGGCP